jgi:thioredoxin-like negative regulator of GroEL
MELLIEAGRFADAEQLVKDAMADPRGDSSGLRLLLGPVFCMQGRNEEATRLIEPSWEHLAATGQAGSGAAISLVRLHVDPKRTNVPVEAIRAFLDEAAASAPQDDRVWLGNANLAIRTGSYDAAARWLEACLRRRPDDAPVWRARLEWATATGRVAQAREAMEHLPSAETTPAQVHRLAAWFASQRGDEDAEEAALARLIKADPTDFAALNRLADLAAKKGQTDRANHLHSVKTEVKRLEARYLRLYARYQPMRDAAEMAVLAERLGRLFEARAFLAIALIVEPDRADLRNKLSRLQPQASSALARGSSLAELLSSELDGQVDFTVPRPRSQGAERVSADHLQ